MTQKDWNARKASKLKKIQINRIWRVHACSDLWSNSHGGRGWVGLFTRRGFDWRRWQDGVGVELLPFIYIFIRGCAEMDEKTSTFYTVIRSICYTWTYSETPTSANSILKRTRRRFYVLKAISLGTMESGT